MNLEMVALLIATMGTVLLSAWMHQRALKMTLFQHEQSIRYLQSQNDKLTSKVMAISNGIAYAQYRAGAAQGVPEGSMPPVDLGNGNGAGQQVMTPERVERLQRDVIDRLRQKGVQFQSPGPYEEGVEP